MRNRKSADLLKSQALLQRFMNWQILQLQSERAGLDHPFSAGHEPRGSPSQELVGFKALHWGTPLSNTAFFMSHHETPTFSFDRQPVSDTPLQA